MIAIVYIFGIGSMKEIGYNSDKSSERIRKALERIEYYANQQ